MKLDSPLMSLQFQLNQIAMHGRHAMSMTRGLPVHGYTDQPTDKIEAVNQNKIAEERILRQLDILGQQGECDPRWLAIARTHFDQAWMSLNRAIFRPERVKLDGDP